MKAKAKGAAMGLDEQELIRGCKAGDKSCMEMLFRSHVDSAVRLAFSITRNWATAEDAVQEAFIQAFRSIGTFQEGKPFKPWLAKIVVNKSRRIGAKFGVSWDELDPNQPNDTDDGTPERLLMEKEDKTRLMQAINLLGEKHRLPLILKYLSGLSEAETSEVLGVPITTVKSRLYVARRQLAEKLALLEGSEQRGKA
ncbi:MAG: sigma-70 family RNA polymerase sigma factor [Firmicutes bacterium]|nr:sigma-70 family RNA polymerase sigma factor [Bacillota bacterium]